MISQKKRKNWPFSDRAGSNSCKSKKEKRKKKKADPYFSTITAISGPRNRRLREKISRSEMLSTRVSNLIEPEKALYPQFIGTISRENSQTQPNSPLSGHLGSGPLRATFGRERSQFLEFRFMKVKAHLLSLPPSIFPSMSPFNSLPLARARALPLPLPSHLNLMSEQTGP